MDDPACHVIYVSRSVGEERLVRADLAENDERNDAVRNEVQPLLEAFGDGLCSLNVCPQNT
jgi:hypothetical protein